MPFDKKENDVVLQAFKYNGSQHDPHSSLPKSQAEEKSTKHGNIRYGIPVPQAKSNLLSFCSYHWLTPLVRQIARTEKEGYDDNALWSCADEDGCELNGERLKEIWQLEVRRKGCKDASFFKCCVLFLKPVFLRLCVASVVFAVTVTLVTILVFRNLVKYLQYGGQGPYYGYLLAGCIFIMSVVLIGSVGFMFSYGNLYGTRLKGAASYLVYETLLRTENVRKNALGEVINVLTTDSLRIYMSVYRLQLVVIFFALSICGITAIWFLINWWTFVALLTFAVVTLFQMIMTMISTKMQEKRLTYTDSRIQKMKEVLTSIRLIKMWAWEKPFLKEIVDERKQETARSEKMAFLTSVGMFQITQAPAIATAVTLILYAYFGNPLTTELAFTVASSMATLRWAFLALPVYGRHLGDLLVSCMRIKALLLRPGDKQEKDMVTDDELAIQMIDASFRWPVDRTSADSHSTKETGTEAYCNTLAEENSKSNDAYYRSKGTRTHQRETSHDYALNNISFEARKGSLIGICGKVGSGKSALVSALLGKMQKETGSSALNGSVAICPQEAWIFNDTVRENVLFGSSYDKGRYDRVLGLTCFDTDLASFPSADLSEVGDRGVTLSGGQRQRLSLARALYSDRDIYILDDPLSALDVTVGQQVFTRCIKEELQDKTVILVTHQLQYLPDCDQVIFLDDGFISECGTHLDLVTQGGEYAKLIKSFYEKIKERKYRRDGKHTRVISKKEAIDNTGSDTGRLTEKETTEHGQVSWATYRSYIRALGGAPAFFVLILSFIFAEAVTWSCDWWLSAWLQQIDSTTTKSSRALHKHVLEKVMDSPVSFFDKTPLGRIMNRFSSDIDIVDTFIPQDGGMMLMLSARLFLAIVSICLVFPIMIVALIPAAFLVSIVGQLGRSSMRQMKRMDNVSRSELVDHVTSTVLGLESVCTYDKQPLFTKRMVNYMDKNSVRLMTYSNCVDWLFSRADLILYCCNLVTAMLVVTFRNVIPPQLGALALSIALQTLKPESHQKIVTTTVDPDWPRRGDVTFNSVSMAYDTSSTNVLKKVSFNVTSGQKIGIVGRTGAGKSSLGVALFRLVELSSGNILIDGVDIGQLNLQQLRSRLSAIPQEPELFAGSIRRNLDPFRNCTDEDIWAALDKSQLKEKVMGLTGRLEHYVENNGDNFSVGERQLLCMSRTLLRKAQIVLLDEATANVDTETDSKIQLMVRECFTDRTVLIIAHRLNTIQHCDKILVMDDGKVHEFDTPDALLHQADSIYRSMLTENSV